MPLHDWSTLKGFEMLHHVWITEVLRFVRPRLPAGYRAYIGATPALGIGAPDEKPDVAVRDWIPETPTEPVVAPESENSLQPDSVVATMELDAQPAVFVAYHNRLVAAIELISPRNKDRPESRAYYLSRYLGYLREGASLLVVDVHRRPLKFSFADAIAESLKVEQPKLLPPLAVAYRVDGPATSGGRLVSIWRRQMTVDQSLPLVQLPLVGELFVPVDLEATYHAAAIDSYLD